MMGKVLTLSRIAFFTIVISACTPSRTFDRAWRAGLLETNDLQDMDITVGISDPCLPPCWQGLEPQESTVEEVVEVLENLDAVDPTSIQIQSIDESGITLITWESALSDSQVYHGGARLSDDKLIFLEMVLVYELTLHDIIMDLGEPVLYEVIPNSTDTSQWMFRFMWPNYGFVAETPLIAAGSTVAPEILVKRVAYFSPGSDAANYFLAKGSTTQFIDEFRSWTDFEELTIP